MERMMPITPPRCNKRFIRNYFKKTALRINVCSLKFEPIKVIKPLTFSRQVSCVISYFRFQLYKLQVEFYC